MICYLVMGLTKKVVERLCEGGTTEAISLNDTNLCVIDCFSATADRNDDLFGQPLVSTIVRPGIPISKPQGLILFHFDLLIYIGIDFSMQPLLIKVNVPQKSSFSINRYSYSDQFPGIWHFHEEYELTLIEKSRGSRMVGDHIERFKVGDLVFIGKNLPHTWRNDEGSTKGASEALVIHFVEDFLGEAFFGLPEMYKIKRLLERSKWGLKIREPFAKKIAALMKRVETSDGAQKVFQLLDILHLLSESEQLEELCSEGFTNSINYADSDRLKRVYEYIMNNFQEDVCLSKAASVAHMSPTAFSRYFKSRTRKSYTQFVIEMKIGYACKLLINEKMSVAEACYKSGFQNLSNFNQQFKSITNLTPKKYQTLHSIT